LILGFGRDFPLSYDQTGSGIQPVSVQLVPRTFHGSKETGLRMHVAIASLPHTHSSLDPELLIKHRDNIAPVVCDRGVRGMCGSERENMTAG
jgi:hypothetical protein